MIKNLIFDLGNVFIEFNPDNIISECTPYFWCNEEYLNLKEVIFEKYINLWDSGYVKYDEMVKMSCIELSNRNCSKLIPYCLDIFDYWFESLKMDPKLLNLVRTLQEKKYKCYVLSNVSDGINLMPEKDKLIKFNGYILSYQVGLLKPAKGIFEKLLKNYKLNPEECLFIDDKEENIKTAEKLNMKGHVYVGYFELIDELKKMEVLKK